MKSNKYWVDRADKRMELAHRNANEVTKEVQRAYDAAIKQITEDMDKILANFANRDGMTESDAIKMLNEKVSKKMMDSMMDKLPTIEDKELRQQLLNKISAQAYKARMTRLQAVKANVQIECAKIADTELRSNNKFFVRQMQETYYRNVFDYSQGVGMALDFSKLPKRKIDEILSTKWSGKHYSSRIWDNNQAFADKLQEIILKGTMNGKNSTVMAKEMSEYANVGKHVSERLLRTETTYISTMADLHAMKDRDTKQLKFVATLDTRTSEQCQKADGSIINVEDAEPGKNVPPLHCYCRSTVIEISDLMHDVRFARDKDGKSIQVPASMTYPEWEKKYLKK